MISFVCSPSLAPLLLCVSRCSRMQGVLPVRGVQPLLALLLLQSVGCGESSLNCMHLLTYSVYSASPEIIMLNHENHRPASIIFSQSQSWSDSTFEPLPPIYQIVLCAVNRPRYSSLMQMRVKSMCKLQSCTFDRLVVQPSCKPPRIQTSFIGHHCEFGSTPCHVPTSAHRM